MSTSLAREAFAQMICFHLRAAALARSQGQFLVLNPEVREIEHALRATGRTIVIYGEREAGTASLIQALAAHFMSDHDPSAFGHNLSTTFSVLIHDTGQHLGNWESTATVEIHNLHRVERPGPRGASKRGPSIGRAPSEEESEEEISFVIDEFDRITTGAERERFSAFIRQMGDRGSPVRIMLCGISRSLQDLLRAHESNYSYVEEAGLTQPGGETGFQTEATATAGNVASPHCVHLVSEELFWEMLNDPTFARSLR